jgi:hypothetical protein
MTRGIVSGALHKAAEVRTSKAGKPFSTFAIRESVNGSTRFWRAVAFDDASIAALKEMAAGSPIGAAGEVDCELYRPEGGGEGRLSWAVKVDGVLTARRPASREGER